MGNSRNAGVSLQRWIAFQRFSKRELVAIGNGKKNAGEGLQRRNTLQRFSKRELVAIGDMCDNKGGDRDTTSAWGLTTQS